MFLKIIINVFFSRFFCQKDVWLGETGSGFDGGTHGLSDRYASGLLWLNKLGLTARHNYKVCMAGFNDVVGCTRVTLKGSACLPNTLEFWKSTLGLPGKN